MSFKFSKATKVSFLCFLQLFLLLNMNPLLMGAKAELKDHSNYTFAIDGDYNKFIGLVIGLIMCGVVYWLLSNSRISTVVNEKETLIVDRTDEYTRVVSYDNYKDMEKHLKSIVSESYISKNLKKSFAQNNDKLYCMEDNGESLNYVNDSFKLEGFLKEKNNVKIVGNYNATNEENKKYNYRVYATLTTNNNNYVVNTYEEY